MKEKNGFTLIELLAVIVILAVIALITTPIIINVIEKARKEAFIDSAYGILDAGKIYYVSKLSDENQFAGKTFDFTKEEDVKELKLGGEAPKGGTLTLDNKGNATLSIYNDKWCVTKTEENSKVEVRELKDGKCIIESGPKAAQTIIDNGIVESGEGLYKNPSNIGGYTFKGANPNNLLIFDNKCFSIMGVEENGQIKIIYEGDTNNGTCNRGNNDVISTLSLAWNTSGTNEWNDANTEIRNKLTELAQGVPFSNFVLSDLDKVANHTWNVGKVYNYHNGMEDLLTQEKSLTWINKVGTVNPSDYVMASTDSECNSYNDAYACRKGNFLSNMSYWLINASSYDPFSSSPYSRAHYIFIGGSTFDRRGIPEKVTTILPLRPVLYLESNVKATGSGTSSNPFVVS